MTPLALEVFLDISGAGTCPHELCGCKVMSYGPIMGLGFLETQMLISSEDYSGH
jgi:hypothetical protein